MAAFRIFKSNVMARGFIRSAIKSITATVTATRAVNSGLTNVLNAAAGLTVTLPATSSSTLGNRFRFNVGTLLTSNSYIIKVANATDVFAGGVLVNDAGDSSAAAADFMATSATSDTFTMAASAGAGRIGDWVEFECIASGTWAVTGMVQMLDPTSPFSATVS
jgi:hypothetical protein